MRFLFLLRDDKKGIDNLGKYGDVNCNNVQFHKWLSYLLSTIFSEWTLAKMFQRPSHSELSPFDISAVRLRHSVIKTSEQ